MTVRLCLTLLLAPWFLPGIATAKDLVLTSQVGEVEVEIFIPAEVKTLRGIIVHAANYKLKADDRWAELCHELEFAHVAMNIPNVQKANNRTQKLHKALHEGLKDFAEKSGHAELVKLPLAGTGHSAGGLVTNVLLQTPERTLAICVDCGWVMDPDKVPSEGERIPALFTMGAVPDAFKMLPSIEQHFEPGGRRGCRGVSACSGVGPRLRQDRGTHAPVAQGRHQSASAARSAPRRRRCQTEGDQGGGGLGSVIAKPSRGISPPSLLRGFQGGQERGGLVAEPRSGLALAGLAVEGRTADTGAATADGKAKLPPWGPKVARDLMVAHGESIDLSVKVKEGTAVKKVQFYDGDRLLGEAAADSWTFTWKKPGDGIHGVWVQWQDANGKPGVTNPALIIIRQGKR